MSQSGVTAVNKHYDWMGAIIMDRLVIFYLMLLAILILDILCGNINLN